MNLALFDLDHTLIPFDSGMAWTQHLVRCGALPARAEDDYLAYCHQYVAGTLDIHAMHQACMGPLAAFEPAQLQSWLSSFEAAMAPRLPPDMRALVAEHRADGDLCVIVTATTRLVAEPFARLFGIEHLLATEAEWRDGRPTGAIAGVPCYRVHKVEKLTTWLAARPLAPHRLAAFGRSTFYSDSSSDLPLLQAVTHPVAVAPDPRLAAHAGAAGWPIRHRGG